MLFELAQRFEETKRLSNEIKGFVKILFGLNLTSVIKSKYQIK